MRATYQAMLFPGKGVNGGYAYNVRISTSYSEHWTSPLVKLPITDYEEARQYVRKQVRALRAACEPEEELKV